MVKKFLCILLCVSLFCTFIGCKKENNANETNIENNGENNTNTPNSGGLGQHYFDTIDYNDVVTAVNVMRDRGLYECDLYPIYCDTEGFTFGYRIATIGRLVEYNSNDLTEFISREGIIEFGVITVVFLENYDCDCIKYPGAANPILHECITFSERAFQKLYGNDTVPPCIEFFCGEVEIDVYDPTLLTYECTWGEVVFEYDILYNGTRIFETRSCVPMDDEIWAMIVDSITVID